MISIKVVFENGDFLITDINATFEEAAKYYVGQSFNFGDTDEYPQDRILKCVAIQEMKEN